jgi:flagellar motor switch protein FliN/FliY
MGVVRTANPPSPTPTRAELDRILHLQVPVIVRLAERRVSFSQVMNLGPGASIEFEKSSDQPLELLINNKPIAVGQAVKVGGNFGLRISQIGEVSQIVKAMGESR